MMNTNAKPTVRVLALWLSLFRPTVVAADEPSRQAMEVTEYAPKDDTFRDIHINCFQPVQ